MRNMVYQNLGLPAIAGGTATDGYAAKAKENKRQEKIAKRQARNAEKASRSEANRQKAQRRMAARAVLDNAGYTDIALANMKQACTGPGCKPQPALRPQTYDQRVAVQNRNIRNQERAAARSQTVVVEKTKAAPVAKGYGYYNQGNRMMPVPVTKDGYVRRDYLEAVQRGRSPQAIARDAGSVSARVYPARVTPKQAGPWIKNPAYADIPGIDAPRDQPPTVYRSRNIAPVRVPVSVQQPRPYTGRAPVRYGSRNTAPQPPYMGTQALLPVSKGVSGYRARDPQGREFVIPQNRSGSVPKAYLNHINDARPARAREADAARASKYVLPASPTPYQARPWVVNPGRYDIPGIDAPEGTPTTYRTARSPEAANRKRATASRKSAANKPRENGKFISAEEAKKKGVEVGKSSKAKKPVSEKKGGASSKPKASAKKDIAPIKTGGKNGQASLNANKKSAAKKPTQVSASKKSSASSKKACGTKKAAQPKRR